MYAVQAAEAIVWYPVLKGSTPSALITTCYHFGRVLDIIGFDAFKEKTRGYGNKETLKGMADLIAEKLDLRLPV